MGNDRVDWPMANYAMPSEWQNAQKPMGTAELELHMLGTGYWSFLHGQVVEIDLPGQFAMLRA